MKIEELVTTPVKQVTKIVCDVCKTGYDCGPDADAVSLYEAQEFLSVTTVGGYDSVFGDGNVIELDICQHCLKARLGDVLRIRDPSA